MEGSGLAFGGERARLFLPCSAQGKTDKAIAEALYVSPLTVKTHLQRVYRKLGVERRAEALSRALQLLELLD
jgi:DNA-binding CsgD family transcriptional regulator